MEQGQFCRIPDVLTFEQGHFLHALPRASILPCPPLWHPACRAPDVIWARTFFLHGLPRASILPCPPLWQPACGTPDVLSFEQGHFLHGLPRASILLSPPLLHPACRTPDVLTFEQGHFFAWVATGLHFALSTTVAPCMQGTWCLDIWERTFFAWVATGLHFALSITVAPCIQGTWCHLSKDICFLHGLPRASILPCPPLWQPACGTPDVLTFEQGHFLHGLPRASILLCPPLWHPACRTPDALTFEQGHFFCMGCHGPPREYYIYICWLHFMLYIFNVFYNIYIYRCLYFLIMTFNCWKISLRHIGTLYSMFNLATQTASRRNRLMSAKEREKWIATRVGRAVAGYWLGILG